MRALALAGGLLAAALLGASCAATPAPPAPVACYLLVVWPDSVTIFQPPCIEPPKAPMRIDTLPTARAVA